MNQGPSLLSTLKLALKQLEAVGPQANPAPDFGDARPALREWIGKFEVLETCDPRVGNPVLYLQDVLLDRKGIFVAATLYAVKVRDILRKRGFEHLADQYSNSDIVGLMIEVREDEYDKICEMQDRFTMQTAREIVKDAGLDWREEETHEPQVRSEAVRANSTAEPKIKSAAPKRGAWRSMPERP